MPVGSYAKVSTQAQDLGLQFDVLKAAGCETVLKEMAERDGLRRATRPVRTKAALGYMHPSGTLMAWKFNHPKRGVVRKCINASLRALAGTRDRLLLNSFLKLVKLPRFLD